MYGVELYAAVRLAVVDEGLSHHEAGRRFGIDRRTVKKMLSYSAPPGYRRTKPVRRPKLDGFTGIVDAILEADTDPDVPRKQRHTAHRIFERLRDEHGFTGGYTIVKDYVRSRRQSVREAFVPLHHPPGHAQVDFGEATVEVGGRREKVAFFCLILPHSNVWFVKAYPRETTEAFLDGHVSAFAFLGGLPRSILYDNTTLAVARILGDGTRRRTQAFTHLQSHYLFRDRFGRPGKGNDKGKVEALVKTARRRFMVPIPKVHDLSVLNERLLARCLERLDALEAGGQAAGLLADLDALRDLPAVPFEACEHVPGQISSTALVRYRLVDYSAPAAHAHKKVTVKGYVDRVEIALGAEIVARHRRSYVRGDIVYDPLHYLSLLEKKPGTLDQAAPLRGWELDPAFDTLRRLLEVRRDEQDETACCLIQECSRVLGPLPHQNVPFAILNHFSRCGDRFLGRHFALFAEHHRRRFLLSPNLHPTLHRAQEPVRVLPGMCRLKPLKQLAARVPRLGLEPSVQLLCDLHQRIGPPPAALRLRHRYGRGPCLAFPPRDAQSGKELLQRRYSRVRRRGDRLVDNVHNALLPYPHLPQQPDWVESGRQLGNSVTHLLRCSGIREQPLAGRGRRMVTLAGTGTIAPLRRQLERGLEEVHEQSRRRVEPG